MKQFIKNFFSRAKRGHSGLESEWSTILSEMDIISLRKAIQAAARENKLPVHSALRGLAVSFGWTGLSLEKLDAYCELYGGNVAMGYQRVVSGGLANDDFEMMMVTASCCYEYRRYEEGWKVFSSFDRTLIPDGEECEYLGQGIALIVASRRDISEALIYADEAIERGDFSMFLAINAYFVYFELGVHDKVRKIHDYMVRSLSSNPYVLQSLSWVELARGYYGEGFRLLEARLALPELRQEVPDRVWHGTRWRGEIVSGMRLLVYEEQGIGDTVMMARYLAELQSRQVKVILAARQQVISLLENCLPDIRYVVRSPRDCEDCDFDQWVPMMSLPHLMNTTADNVPRKSGYLVAPREQYSYWSNRIGGLSRAGRLKVGIAWSGNPEHKFDKRRSLDFSEVEQYIRLRKDVDFYALQIQTPEIYPSNFYVLSDEFATLSDTAALIELMDVVISVDTSVIHLAGALGKKALLLLPYRYEWRWGLQGEENAWYDSVRVMRQARHSYWTDVLDRIFDPEHRLLYPNS